MCKPLLLNYLQLHFHDVGGFCRDRLSKVVLGGVNPQKPWILHFPLLYKVISIKTDVWYVSNIMHFVAHFIFFNYNLR